MDLKRFVNQMFISVDIFIQIKLTEKPLLLCKSDRKVIYFATLFLVYNLCTLIVNIL